MGGPRTEDWACSFQHRRSRDHQTLENRPATVPMRSAQAAVPLRRRAARLRLTIAALASMGGVACAHRPVVVHRSQRPHRPRSPRLSTAAIPSSPKSKTAPSTTSGGRPIRTPGSLRIESRLRRSPASRRLDSRLRRTRSASRKGTSPASRRPSARGPRSSTCTTCRRDRATAASRAIRGSSTTSSTPTRDCASRASSCQRSTRASSWPARSSVGNTSMVRRRPKPACERTRTRCTDESIGTGWPRTRRRIVAGLDARRRFHPVRHPRLQRGDDRVPPRHGIADARIAECCLGGVHPHVPLGKMVRPGLPRLRPGVRVHVLAHLDRFPRHAGPVHARARDRLLRGTRAAQHARNAPTPCTTPWDGSAMARTTGVSARATDPPTCRCRSMGSSAPSAPTGRGGVRTRASPTTAPSRRHRPRAASSRSHRSLPSPRSRRCGRPTAISCTPLTASSTRSTRRSHCPSAHRSAASTGRARLGRHRQPRHRRGSDPRDDRELPDGAHLDDHASQPLSHEGPRASRVLRRMAWSPARCSVRMRPPRTRHPLSVARNSAVSMRREIGR